MQNHALTAAPLTPVSLPHKHNDGFRECRSAVSLVHYIEFVSYIIIY